jgi:hypothetical protein
MRAALDAVRARRRELVQAFLALTWLPGCAQATLDSLHADPVQRFGLSVSSVDVAKVSPSTPLYLDVWAMVHGTAVGPLFPYMVLHSGDRIGLQARTSGVANVYVMHCDASAALSVFPASGPIAFPADQRVELPAVGKDLRLTTSPGDEILYVLASRQPLAASAPALQAILARTEASGARQVCSREFEDLLAGPNSPHRTTRTEQRAALRGVGTRDSYSSAAHAFAADDGVIVLRFPFRHLP